MISAGVNIDVPKKGGAASKTKILNININDKNEYFINNKKIPISSKNIKKEILNNLGRDSVISLYGSNESSWEASVYIIDIAKQNDIKISLNGTKK